MTFCDRFRVGNRWGSLIVVACVVALAATTLRADPVVTWDYQMPLGGGDPGCPMSATGGLSLDLGFQTLTQFSFAGQGCRVDYVSYDPANHQPFNAFYEIKLTDYSSNFVTFPTGGLPASSVTSSAFGLTEIFELGPYYGPQIRIAVTIPAEFSAIDTTPSEIALSIQAEEFGEWGRDEGADFETPVSGDDWVVPVPEAPTLLLLATGMFVLLALAGLRRRA